MWEITDTLGRTISVDDLPADAVAYDESGFGVDLDDLRDSPDAETLADNGYLGRDSRRILIWEDSSSSENDAGGNAIASAVWVQS